MSLRNATPNVALNLIRICDKKVDNVSRDNTLRIRTNIYNKNKNNNNLIHTNNNNNNDELHTEIPQFKILRQSNPCEIKDNTTIEFKKKENKDSSKCRRNENATAIQRSKLEVEEGIIIKFIQINQYFYFNICLRKYIF